MDTLQEIISSLRKNGLRTFLTGFTVALGLFIFITLFGMGNGLQNSFNKEFIAGSANSIFINAGVTSEPFEGLKENRKIQFTNKDLLNIKEKFGDQIKYYTSAIYSVDQVKNGSEYGSYTIRAVQPARQIIELNTIIKGRSLDENDLEQKLKNVCIGRLVEQDLFPGENSLGKILNISGVNFKVVGVFSDEGGDREERIIYMPITVKQLLEGMNPDIDQIVLGYDPSIPTTKVIKTGENIESYLKQQHQIAPNDESAIYVRNDAKDQGGVQGFMLVLTVIVGIIGFGTLVAGMMGIFNIMVYSVKERTKEIGLRKAIGAKPNNIIRLILYESIIVTLLAGIVGIIAGVSFLNYLGDKLEEYFIYNPSVSPTLIIVALFCLVIAGFVAGLIPSYRASKIKPIEALRNE